MFQLLLNWLVQGQSNLRASSTVQVPALRVRGEREGGGSDLSISRTISPSVEPEIKHYTDFDCKVIDYMNRLERQDHVKTDVALAKLSRCVLWPVKYRNDFYSQQSAVRRQ